MPKKTSDIKILVTGAKGQLGLKIRDAATNYTRFNFDYFDIDELDITNPKALNDCLANGNYFALINCAAYTAVDKAESDQKMAFLINSEAPANMALFCQKYNIHFIHFSTDYVFDGLANKPYKEEHLVSPLSVYGESKALGEKKVIDNNGNALVIRTSWLYSEYGTNFVKTILRLAGEKDMLKVVNDQYGSPTYAGDLAMAVLQILDDSLISSNIHPGIYHYSNLGSCTWYEFAKYILLLSGINTPVVAVTADEFPVVAIRPKYSVFDKSKIIETFNLSIPNWEVSLKIMLENYLLK